MGSWSCADQGVENTKADRRTWNLRYWTVASAHVASVYVDGRFDAVSALWIWSQRPLPTHIAVNVYAKA